MIIDTTVIDKVETIVVNYDRNLTDIQMSSIAKKFRLIYKNLPIVVTCDNGLHVEPVKPEVKIHDMWPFVQVDINHSDNISLGLAQFVLPEIFVGCHPRVVASMIGRFVNANKEDVNKFFASHIVQYSFENSRYPRCHSLGWHTITVGEVYVV